MKGNISDFNMWSGQLSVEVLQQLGCDSEGDIINKDTLQVYGEANWVNKTYPCAGIIYHSKNRLHLLILRLLHA